MSETYVMVSVKGFCSVLLSSFGKEYLRQPSNVDLVRIMTWYSSNRLPGCIGCLDCKHWRWANRPMSMAGMFSGKVGKPIVVLKANVAGSELWIWHLAFGFPGSLNDIDILNSSTTIQGIM
ncbi:hypothetical protein BWQ96_08366 [Gracilariopsis chorda]|uniref:DDE Tnp4 domain-containing protein n=1 Tax=Gracilariopsis chorda TaxID=448386 RepID=A0A2V3IIJ6_9FLOR|nr:hypothetical protein BWQ96_08366 [Gracilariopsis chorda]|eukprot:PXF41914.1 hypothetical protein BWQ96_08366 [Gracilariopsis chorda]